MSRGKEIKEDDMHSVSVVGQRQIEPHQNQSPSTHSHAHTYTQIDTTTATATMYHYVSHTATLYMIRNAQINVR